jgi:quercetin dioxygenase-like cupin family protein
MTLPPRPQGGFKAGNDWVYQRGDETESLLLDMWVPPHTQLPALHSHPEQRESFHVLSGEFAVRRDAELHQLGAGDAITVAPGQWHSVGNLSDTGAMVFTEIDPGLDTQSFFEGLAQVEQSRDPLTTLMRFAALVREFPREYRYSLPVTAIFVTAAGVGRTLRIAKRQRPAGVVRAERQRGNHRGNQRGQQS